jgi:hypothetical protein
MGGGSTTYATGGSQQPYIASGTGTHLTSSGASAFHTHDVTTGNASQDHTHTFSIASSGTHSHTISGSTDSNGSGTAHNNVSKSILGSWYLKL